MNEGRRSERALRRFRISREPALTYAVGDVHGCFDELLELEAAIVRDAEGRPGVRLIVMLGDYVDRGPRSAHVLEHLASPPPPGFHRICLLGNHEAMLLSVLEGKRRPSALLPFGSLATLASYGCDLEEYENGLSMNDRTMAAELLRRVPARHRGFLRGLPVLFETPSRLFVHAGIRPGVPLERQSDADLLWIREPFLSAERPSMQLVVHGHTAFAEPRIGAGRIGIDTGAGYGGALTAVRLDGGPPAFLQAGSGPAMSSIVAERPMHS